MAWILIPLCIMVGILELVMILQYLAKVGGSLLLIIGLFAYPITFFIAPLYAGFIDGYWLLLGVSLVGKILFFLSAGMLNNSK